LSPTQLMENVYDVTVGGLHTMVIGADGSVWYFGSPCVHLVVAGEVMGDPEQIEEHRVNIFE